MFPLNELQYRPSQVPILPKTSRILFPPKRDSVKAFLTVEILNIVLQIGGK